MEESRCASSERKRVSLKGNNDLLRPLTGDGARGRSWGGGGERGWLPLAGWGEADEEPGSFRPVMRRVYSDQIANIR